MNKFSKTSVNNREHKNNVPQVNYMGRWVNKNLFRVFVYNKDGEEKLANNYKEFQDLISSGLWYETREQASSKKGKMKDDSVRTTS